MRRGDEFDRGEVSWPNTDEPAVNGLDEDSEDND
jgi:hypothetical protein